MFRDLTTRLRAGLRTGREVDEADEHALRVDDLPHISKFGAFGVAGARHVDTRPRYRDLPA